MTNHTNTSAKYSAEVAQMRPTLEGEMPISAAIVARLQWVAFAGISVTVFASTFCFTAAGNCGYAQS